jgi:scyllo-inositol 2-dehydrogenase (NADP+)
MRVAIVGLGIQGKKRMAIAADDVVARVDTQADGDCQTIDQVPLTAYEAALVCTPDKPKLEILRYLLSHGKHVLVEKPLLAEDENQLRELYELSRSNNATCYTAYNHRFEPHLVRVKETIASGALGQLYLVRVFYGNGTAMDVQRSPWRDRGVGVLSDIGSHLLDTMLFLLGDDVDSNFEVWSYDAFENRACDHVLFGLRGKSVLELEASLVSWRNTFTLDLYGEKGSVHIDCLCKWGPSTYRVRQRVFPSGRPSEEVETLEMPDPTWALEYNYFKDLCRRGGTNIENDIWINDVLKRLARVVDKELV